MEARLSLCNLSIEMGARFGMIAPDDTTLEYLASRVRAQGRAVGPGRRALADPALGRGLRV